MARQRVETILFRGVKFRRYPDSPNANHRNYFSPGIAARQAGIEDLHREIYKVIYGEIPEGFDVHHSDEDFSNNDPGNYELLGRPEHTRHHVNKRLATPEGLAQARQHIADIRPLASAWHQSPEGRAWHSENSKDIWKNPPLRQFVCTCCGKRFMAPAIGVQSKFCSAKCAAKARRDSGVDDVDHECPHCHIIFKANKYADRKYCSRRCSKSAYWAARKGV